MSFGRTGVVIIGGGPAGLAPLLAAHRRGRLAELLEQGVTVVEQSDAVGEGSIGRWCINSDSTGFYLRRLSCGTARQRACGITKSSPYQRVRGGGRRHSAACDRAAEFLALVGQAMNEVIAAAPNGRVLKRTQGNFDPAHRDRLAARLSEMSRPDANEPSIPETSCLPRAPRSRQNGLRVK